MENKCVHCGEDCGKHPVIWDGKPFCCHGCKTVYQILNEKKLDKYYDIISTPGIRIDEQELGDKFAYLDLDEIKDKLLTFSDSGVSKVELFIPTIHCASCIWLLENLNTLNPGIVYSMVDFPKKTVNITYKENQITLRQLVELLASIHYLPEITLDSAKKKSGKSNRDLLLKLGVAGFSLLNVMLYNFPEYLPGGDQLEQMFVSYFGWLSFTLSLPVVFYSANDYYLSAFKGLKHRIVNIDVPITLGIFMLFIQSTYELFSGKGIGYFDSLVGLVFLLLIGKWYQGKTYQALSFERDYKSYFPIAVTLVRDGHQVHIPLEEVKPGDSLVIRNQELIPVDSKITKGNASIDYSFVTGESMPVPKTTGDIVFAGGRQVGEAIQVEVIKNVEQSYLTQLWNEKSGSGESSILKTFVNKVSEYFTIIILLIAASAGIYWLLTDSSVALFAFTSVLIIACPCALALTVPFTFGSTMRVFGRRGFYLKNTDVIERLYKADTIVFDKTGTLTLSKSMNIEWEGEALTEENTAMIRAVVENSSHPLSAAIARTITDGQKFIVKDFQEITAMGITGIINGIRVNVGSSEFVTGKKETTAGSTKVYVSINNRIRGYFRVENHYRHGLEKLITNLKKRYKLYLLSGDNESEKQNLSKIFGEQASLNFNQSPQDKRDFIEKLKKEGANVIMIGDGLNDAGALMASDAGITIADDIYSFTPACDGIVNSSAFDKLFNFVRFTSVSMRVVRLSFAISFLYNAVGIWFAVQGALSPLIAAILMPISSISVVAFATFSVSVSSKHILFK